MLANIFLVATEVIILFILIAVGGAATKLKWLTKDSATQMTNIVLYFATPCIVVESFNAVRLTPDLVLGLGKTAVIAIVVHTLGIFIATFLFRRKPQKQRSIFNVSAVFPNCGFMG
ncbi:MAG: AEC family transporter, partial [Firmicutes bacterium]|nr:AEC family transporter [Bacillota bacterium]